MKCGRWSPSTWTSCCSRAKRSRWVWTTTTSSFGGGWRRKWRSSSRTPGVAPIRRKPNCGRSTGITPSSSRPAHPFPSNSSITVPSVAPMRSQTLPLHWRCCGRASRFRPGCRAIGCWSKANSAVRPSRRYRPRSAPLSRARFFGWSRPFGPVRSDRDMASTWCAYRSWFTPSFARSKMSARR